MGNLARGGRTGEALCPSRKCPSCKNEISVERAALAICREARDFVHALCFGNLRQLIKLRLFKAVAVAVPAGSMLPAKQVIVVFKLGCIKTGKRGGAPSRSQLRPVLSRPSVHRA